MTAAMEAARNGATGPLWIIADGQTAGRGRQGRVWQSPPGNLYATLLLTDPCAPSDAAALGFVAGLAVHDAVAALTGIGAPRLALKWPNDLLLEGAKCAGLLLEASILSGRFHVAIGIGANVATAPEGTPYPALALGAAAPGLPRDALMCSLADAMAARLAQWQAEGLAPLLADWRARAAFLGKDITIRLPEGPMTGRFADIDATGRLKLLTDQGLRVIDAGDLFFPA